jgi:hypothetical protein
MPLLVILPTDEFPPGIPFTLQVTAVFVALLTIAMKVCGSPNRTVATDGAITTLILGGGCDGPVPTTPVQPRKDATRRSAGHQ